MFAFKVFINQVECHPLRSQTYNWPSNCSLQAPDCQTSTTELSWANATTQWLIREITPFSPLHLLLYLCWEFIYIVFPFSHVVTNSDDFLLGSVSNPFINPFLSFSFISFCIFICNSKHHVMANPFFSVLLLIGYEVKLDVIKCL